ncbi:MAG TPA: cation:proton antiporter [Candidatus Mucispirillum faecigallinarum]|uniref:Cation:proton antiporter n=1 Tax=Candidatus Mucispirillum faecigallinarum TaxID=2838699 RepID=A0A9D2GUQ9_9BACT|nr:cation:proton antiporter [Candidatus Mucispirillum faecigallinarum]
MTEHEALFLFLMAIGAFFMPFISKRLLLPASVGEIIYGIVIASLIPYGESQFEMVDYFSSLGFLILMYLAGLEINFEKFRALSRKELWLYVAAFIPVAVTAWYLSYYLELHWSFGIIFFTSGIGLLFPVLRDTDLIKTDFGQKLLIITMIGEILTLAGLTVFTIISKYGYTIQSARQILYLAVFFIVIYLIMKVLKVALWWKPNLQSVFVEVGNPTETGMRANFVILFAFVAFAAVLEIEFVVGAFVGGMMFALVFAGRDGVLDKLGGVGYGFFIPIFFISVGMRVTFNDFLQKDVIMLALLIIASLFISKVAGIVLLLFSSIPKQKLLLVATGLSFPLTMLVVVSSIFYDLNLIDKMQTSAVLLASMISAIVFPWVFKAIAAVIMPDEDIL